MNRVPVLSVIVRTLARNERLAECLDSLAQQNTRDFEVVVVDMSGGAAADVIGSPRDLHLTHLDTQGRVLNRAVALNYGIRRASGKFIAVLDDDNIWSAPQAKTLIRLFGDDTDLVYTGTRRLINKPDGTKVREECRFTPFNYEKLVRGNYIYATAMAFQKKSWERVGRYDARFHVYEDWEFLIRLARSGKVVTEESFWAYSRSFTGVPGVSDHNLDKADCDRCRAAVVWKHRQLYVDDLAETAPMTQVRRVLEKPLAERFFLLFDWWRVHGFASLKFYPWNQ